MVIAAVRRMANGSPSTRPCICQHDRQTAAVSETRAIAMSTGCKNGVVYTMTTVLTVTVHENTKKGDYHFTIATNGVPGGCPGCVDEVPVSISITGPGGPLSPAAQTAIGPQDGVTACADD
jgi:hypothetical protein